MDQYIIIRGHLVNNKNNWKNLQSSKKKMIEFLCLRMNNDRPKESPKVKQTDAFDDNRSNEKRRNSHISNLIFSTSTLYVYSKWIREAIAIKFAKRYASFATFGSMSQESMCCASCFTPTTSVMLLQQQRSFFLSLYLSLIFIVSSCTCVRTQHSCK